MGKKVQICYVVNRNEDFLVIFCINFVPWWWNIRFFFDIRIIYIWTCTIKIPKHYLIWQQHFPCVYLHILDAILTLFAPVMHRQSCLPSGLTVAAPDAFGRIPGVWHFVEINILTLKMLKINNLSSSVKKTNSLTLTFLQFGGGGGLPIFPIYFC